MGLDSITPKTCALKKLENARPITILQHNKIALYAWSAKMVTTLYSQEHNASLEMLHIAGDIAKTW